MGASECYSPNPPQPNPFNHIKRNKSNKCLRNTVRCVQRHTVYFFENSPAVTADTCKAKKQMFRDAAVYSSQPATSSYIQKKCPAQHSGINGTSPLRPTLCPSLSDSSPTMCWQMVYFGDSKHRTAMVVGDGCWGNE